MRTGACFGVELHGEYVTVLIADALAAAVVYVGVAHFGDFGVDALFVYDVAVVLRRDVDPAGFKLLDGVIRASVTVFELVGVKSAGKGYELVS